MLEHEDMLITEVAAAVGVADSSYFARVFRREVGVSPSAHQQEPRWSSVPHSSFPVGGVYLSQKCHPLSHACLTKIEE